MPFVGVLIGVVKKELSTTQSRNARHDDKSITQQQREPVKDLELFHHLTEPPSSSKSSLRIAVRKKKGSVFTFGVFCLSCR